MNARDRIVHGAFTNSDEAIAEIKKLQEEGYSKDHITVYSSKPDYEASEDNPRIEDGSFDITEENSKERSEEGTFDTTDENSKERSTHGSFDRVDKSETTNKKADSDDDNSLWESVKDFFTPDTYDYEMESQNPDYNQEQDVLYPYRDTLNNGGHIIILNNMNMDNQPGGF